MGSNCCSKKNQCCPEPQCCPQQQCCPPKCGPKTQVCSSNVHVWQMAPPQMPCGGGYGGGFGGGMGYGGGGGIGYGGIGGGGYPMQGFNGGYNGGGFGGGGDFGGYTVSPPSFQPQPQMAQPIQFPAAAPQMSSAFAAAPPPLPPQPFFPQQQFQSSQAFQPFQQQGSAAFNCPNGQCQPAPPVQTVQRMVTMRREQVPRMSCQTLETPYKKGASPLERVKHPSEG